MRVEQVPGTRGSLKWIQRLVEFHPHLLDDELRSFGALGTDQHLQWLSPLREDAWAEYRDERWLQKIGHPELGVVLKEFWPRRGPQWDALAIDGANRVFLVEAKAHGAEMLSSCQASGDSRARVEQALEATKLALGADPSADWLSSYYQYANRLAHLKLLQDSGVNAWLIFLYFTGDDDMRGPSDRGEWETHLETASRHLRLPSSVPCVVTLFRSVRDLA